MPQLASVRWARRSAFAVAIVLIAGLLGRADTGTACLTMKDLQRMSPCELAALYERSEVGTPFTGRMEGKILYVADAKFPKLRAKVNSFAWRGKTAQPSGDFTNRWVGGLEAINSRYEIGPSWIDGKPAIVMQYPRDTKLLGNVRDEVREVAPGLYLGPIFDRCPCPKFTGYLALQCAPVKCCK